MAIIAEVAVGGRQGGGRRSSPSVTNWRSTTAASRCIRCCSTSAPASRGQRCLPLRRRPTPTADLFLPLRYGSVMLRDRMPRRFYCRARWQTSDADSEVQVFDLDFVDREGHNLGGIREFTVKRAPREALLRSLGGDATRMLYSVGWREISPPAELGGESIGGNWLVAGFDELAGALEDSVVVDRVIDAGHCTRLFADAAERGTPISGMVMRVGGAPNGEESSTAFEARLEAEVGNLLGAVHALLEQEGTVLTGGLWIVTERAVATEAGEPVDPVQAALWGLGRTVIAEQPMLRCRLVDHDGS